MSKVWFVTGCSTGFGRLLCERLLRTDDRVVATARNARDLEGLAGSDDRLLRLPLDVMRNVQVRSAAAAAQSRFGRIDVLVNNAGYGYFALQESGDVDEVQRMFETNVFGLIRVTQAVLPGMRERRGGTIINISSIAGRTAFPRSGYYNASKFAVEALSESLHYEVGEFGVRVVVIEPGSYDTDFGPRSALRDAELTAEDSPYRSACKRWDAAFSRIIPRKQDPAEVVEAILRAASGAEPFLRLPVGEDARALVALREGRPDAEFIREMDARWSGGG